MMFRPLRTLDSIVYVEFGTMYAVLRQHPNIFQQENLETPKSGWSAFESRIESATPYI
jgi:hypothetical protein